MDSAGTWRTQSIGEGGYSLITVGKTVWDQTALSINRAIIICLTGLCFSDQTLASLKESVNMGSAMMTQTQLPMLKQWIQSGTTHTVAMAAAVKTMCPLEYGAMNNPRKCSHRMTFSDRFAVCEKCETLWERGKWGWVPNDPDHKYTPRPKYKNNKNKYYRKKKL